MIIPLLAPRMLWIPPEGPCHYHSPDPHHPRHHSCRRLRHFKSIHRRQRRLLPPHDDPFPTRTNRNFVRPFGKVSHNMFIYHHSSPGRVTEPHKRQYQVHHLHRSPISPHGPIRWDVPKRRPKRTKKWIGAIVGPFMWYKNV